MDQEREENPLYLFDKAFVKKIPSLTNDYTVPIYFNEDLFSLLGDARPDYRWLIIGPPRSGSTFHIDPNSTSAWNAVITGSKKWIMFPPNCIPPGVMPSSDMSEVVSPVSLMEWFLNFYTLARQSTVKPIECIVKAGEVIFVPNGWWHLVINLEESIAITQNYVSHRNINNVLQFLYCKRSQVSGVPKDQKESLAELFVSKYDAVYPGVLNKTIAKLTEPKNEKISLWKSLTSTCNSTKASTIFTFNF